MKQMNNLKSFTEVNQCRNFNCKFHEPGNVGCRLKYVHIGIEGKCVYCEEKDMIDADEKEPKINIENSISIDRKYIHEKIIPEIIAVFNKARIDLEKVNNMGESG